MRLFGLSFLPPTIALLAGCAGASDGGPGFRLMNKPAPDFQLTALDGAKVKLSDFKGKPVVLAFFAFG